MTIQPMTQSMRAGNEGGSVYFMTNEIDGKNAVIMHQRAGDGSLSLVGAFATGGSGAGIGPEEPYADPLGSQSSLVMSKEHGLLFAVNAGSNEISVFHRQPHGLSLLSKVSSAATSRSAWPCTAICSTPSTPAVMASLWGSPYKLMDS